MYSYVKISDKAGNATCFGSDGAIFDLMAPAINGIKNGATYYVTQSVTVTDENLDSVTINGSEMTGEPFSLAGDTGANYTIIATDKAGSTTEYNVTMKPIENLIESIADLTTGNVTSDDQETVKSVKKNKGRGYRGRETGFARDHRQMR